MYLLCWGNKYWSIAGWSDNKKIAHEFYSLEGAWKQADRLDLENEYMSVERKRREV